MLTNCLIAGNPFFDAYSQSDLLGKLIILFLILLSICSWVILLHKIWITKKVRENSSKFKQTFNTQKLNPLSVDSEPQEGLNPFKNLYTILKKNTLELLHRNQHLTGKNESFLSPRDINFVDSHLMNQISYQTKFLEKNLFILPTVVSLGPFLGLLGTVWGILTTFSVMTEQTGGTSSQEVLGGLSLALATTVLGLVNAIPALVGYNYLKSTIRDYETDMEGFAHEILSSVELQYRKSDLEPVDGES